MRSFWLVSFICGIAATQQVLDGSQDSQGNQGSCNGAVSIDFQCSGIEAKLDEVVASIANLTSKMGSEPEWKLVFKAVAGIAPTDSTDQYLIDPYAAWSRDEPTNEDVPEARELNNHYQGHYKSSFALNWQRRNIKEVKVAYLDLNGAELISMEFDAEGSDRDNWFRKDRVLNSSYDDLISEPHIHRIFSIAGDANHNRRFFINRSYGGCGIDAGWAIVIGKNPSACSWEHPSEAKPIFLYSNKKTFITWTNAADVARAELFAIFVKTKSRYRH